MRLSRATLAQLPAQVARPDYDPTCVSAGIVHLGLGAFHRAHQAAYTDRVLAVDPTWGIIGVSLRDPATRDALAPQDHLYSLLERAENDTRARVIGSLIDALVAPESPQAVIDALAAPSTRVVSMTITEKGYDAGAANGAISFLVRGLAQRIAAGRPLFTVLSCDNLAGNGALVRKLILEFAARTDPSIVRTLERDLACPNTMVDRIVPSTTDADRQEARALLRVDDAWPVAAEPFTQWVIEDRFPAGRPRWEDAGAQFVDDVRPYELMKLRLLNTSHSCLAYLGAVAGYATIDQAIADRPLAQFVSELMLEEVATTLPASIQPRVADYVAQLMTRWRNPGIGHRLQQIAMDGSVKIPQRFVGTIRERLAAGQSIDRLALGIAAWIRYLDGRDEAGCVYAIDDPMGPRLRRVIESTAIPAERARGILAIDAVFGAGLVADARFTSCVVRYLEMLHRASVRESIARVPGSGASVA